MSGKQTYLVKTLRFKFDSNAVHCLAHGNDETTVDHELCELCTALVAISPMPYEKLGKVAELRDGEVGS